MKFTSQTPNTIWVLEGQLTITESNFETMSLVVELDVTGCMRNNYWYNSQWHLKNGMGYCEYSLISLSSMSTEEQCAEFPGLKQKILIDRVLNS